MTAAALAAALAATLAAAPSPFTVEAHPSSRRHPQLVLAPREGNRAALVVRFAAGAVEDGLVPGLTRVAQRALVEANQRHRYEALVRDLFAADGTLAIETGIREATFVLEADRRDFDRLAGILLDLVLSPRLDAELFKRARERAMNDERESTGREDWLSLITPKVIDEASYGNAPYGELESLERIRLAQVEEHLARALSPANATVVAAGAFDARALRARVARYEGAPFRRLPDPQLSTPFSLMLPARREIYLLAFRTRFDTPARTAAARVAAAILEERVHHGFREKGVGYSELVVPEHRSWVDLFLFVLPAHDPSSLPLGALLEDEVDRVRAGKFSDAELDRNRAWALAALRRVDGEPAALARELADGADPAWWGPEVAAHVEAMDRAALEPHLRELFAEDAAVRILYSPTAVRRGPIPDSFRRSAR